MNIPSVDIILINTYITNLCQIRNLTHGIISKKLKLYTDISLERLGENIDSNAINTVIESIDIPDSNLKKTI